jgi:toxin FitB
VKYLLDTNVASEPGKPSPDPACMAWLEAHTHESALSAITLAELRFGIERLADGKHKSQRRRDFEFMLADYTGRFFEFDGPAAVEWGRYAAELEAHFGSDWWKTYDQRDTMLAAISREYGLTIATRNTKHFPFCKVINPFDSKHPPGNPAS